MSEDFEHRGQYEAARDALGDLWQGVGQRPRLAGLSETVAAEVLLRVGSLSGWLGSARQLEGAQDAAKDLISESIARFEKLGEPASAAAAQSELGFCYRRAGAYDEARVMYREALNRLADTDEHELQAKTLLRLVIVESCSGRHNDALRLLTDATGLFEASADDTLKGKYHNELACALTSLSKAERRPDYADRAIIEYSAASYYFEQAGHTSYRARAENNLGYLLYTIERHAEAHEHLNAARLLFIAAKDKGSVAQVDETRARVLLAEGRTQEARRAIREAVRVLENGGEQALLAEALTTQGRVLAKSGDFTESGHVLRRAADVAEAAGAIEDAGLALLTLLEDHVDRCPERESMETYRRADDLLKGTQDAGTLARLRACAHRIMAVRLAALPLRQNTTDFWAGFSLPERVRAYEARYIKRALHDAGGSITQAARLLGWEFHATLQSMLKQGNRHQDLAHLRTPPEKRRKSIIRRPPVGHAAQRVVSILHVEDHPLVASTVKDFLETATAGWKVKTCADGAQAKKLLATDDAYSLFVFDYDLPGQNGIELTRYARTLPHRRRVPIIMFTAADIGTEARNAGATAVLRKPDDLERLAKTVKCLLNKISSA